MIKAWKSIRTDVWWTSDQASRLQTFKVPYCHQNERAVGRCINCVCAQAVGLTLLWLKNSYVQYDLWKKSSVLERTDRGVLYHESSPKCLRLLRAHCAPELPSFLWRRDKLRFPMVLTVMQTMRGFWHGQTSKERQSHKLFLPCYFIRHPYLLPSIIWKMWFIQLYKVWTVSQGILGTYASRWNFQIY